MPKIVSLNFYPKTNLVDIQLSDLESVTVDGELALEKNLKKGEELDLPLLIELTRLSLIKRLRHQAFFYLAIRPRSTAEMKNYLNEKIKKLSEILKPYSSKLKQSNIITEIINDLTTRKYLNDEDFARNYIQQQMSVKAQGKQALSYGLFKKGIDKKIILKLLNDRSLINEENTATSIDQIINKTARVIFSRNLEKVKAKEMLFRRLLSRGFSYDSVRTKIDVWMNSEYNKRVN